MKSNDTSTLKDARHATSVNILECSRPKEEVEKHK